MHFSWLLHDITMTPKPFAARELPLRLAIRLAEYYGVSVDYLVGLTDEPSPYPRSRRTK